MIVSTVVEVEVVVVVCSILPDAPTGEELANIAVKVVCTVWNEIRVWVVVIKVVGAAAPWLVADGIGRGETMTEEMTGMTEEALEGELGRGVIAGMLEVGIAAPPELTGSGTIVSVIGVTPADEIGVATVVSRPIVNDRETVGTTKKLELVAGCGAGEVGMLLLLLKGTAVFESGPDSGAAVLLLAAAAGTELEITEGITTAIDDVEATVGDADLEDAAREEPGIVGDTDCVMVEIKVDKIVEMVVVV